MIAPPAYRYQKPDCVSADWAQIALDFDVIRDELPLLDISDDEIFEMYVRFSTGMISQAVFDICATPPRTDVSYSWKRVEYKKSFESAMEWVFGHGHGVREELDFDNICACALRDPDDVRQEIFYKTKIDYVKILKDFERTKMRFTPPTAPGVTRKLVTDAESLDINW